MFEKARLKLTAQYLAIIMSVSLLFSGVIYWQMTKEFRRRLDAIENRYPLHDMGFRPMVGQEWVLQQDYEFVKKRIILILGYINGVILIVSAGGGYYLASKTLWPIEEAMDEQKRFISDASHELKTPLTALMTSIEVSLRDKNLKLSEAKQVLNDSLSDISGLTKLTNDLLALSRLEQKANNMNERVDLKSVTNEAIRMLSPIAKRNKINIKLSGKKVVFVGNQDSVLRLIMILLDNAIKFSPKNGVVKIGIAKVKRNAEIKIIDHGNGISKNEIDKIFDRFYKSDKSRSKYGDSNGFGLGLSLAKKIVEAHNGSISVKSKEGEGSEFIVKLPVIKL